MCKVPDEKCLVKRETGENPVRTRHRNSRAEADTHWETGKGAKASERSVGRPAFRSTGIRTVTVSSNWEFRPRGTGSTKLRKSESDWLILV